MIYLDTYESPVGELSLASNGTNLCGLWISGQKYYQDHLAQRIGLKSGAAAEQVEGAQAREQAPVLKEARAWLDVYFEGRNPGALPPVRLHGTPFQEEVWAKLCEIPYGELTTYGAIAESITRKRGKGKTSARAVGVAVGRNPLSIIVPCHRVVGASGSLTGYAGGINKKIALLKLEGIDVDQLTIPTHGTAL